MAEDARTALPNDAEYDRFARLEGTVRDLADAFLRD